VVGLLDAYYLEEKGSARLLDCILRERLSKAVGLHSQECIGERRNFGPVLYVAGLWILRGYGKAKMG
jgi:hypothetical protein